MTAAAAPTAKGGFSARTVLILILVGVFSFAGVMVLSAYAPDMQRGDNGAGHAMSRSAIGFAAATRVLAAAGRPVLMSRGPLGQNAADGVLVLTPSEWTDPEALKAVRHDGATLVVLPKWEVRGHPQRQGWVQSHGLLNPRAVLRPLGEGFSVERNDHAGELRLFRPGGTPFAGSLGRVDAVQSISGPDLVPVLVDEYGAALLAMNAKTRVYVLAEPDLLNTHGLKDLRRAAAADEMLRLIWAGDGPVIFDLTLHGLTRTRNLLKLMLEPPLLGATLCLLAAALLVGFQAAVRFGPAREAARAIALGKRALADNTAGLVRLARREHRMAAPYAALVRNDVARAVAAPRNLEGEALDAFLDRLGERLGAAQRYTALAAEARAAKTPGDLLKVARNLHRWKLEMTRARQ